jgi:hypothetical protein
MHEGTGVSWENVWISNWFCNSVIESSVLVGFQFCTQSFPGFHVGWYSPTEVYLYREAILFKLGRAFMRIFGFGKCECNYCGFIINSPVHV